MLVSPREVENLPNLKCQKQPEPSSASVVTSSAKQETSCHCWRIGIPNSVALADCSGATAWTENDSYPTKMMSHFNQASNRYTAKNQSMPHIDSDSEPWAYSGEWNPTVWARTRERIGLPPIDLWCTSLSACRNHHRELRWLYRLNKIERKERGFESNNWSKKDKVARPSSSCLKITELLEVCFTNARRFLAFKRDFLFTTVLSDLKTLDR